MNETDSINASAMQELTKRATQLWWRCEAAIERIERWVKTIMSSVPETGRGAARVGTDESVRGSETAHVNNNRIDIKVDANALAIIALIVAAVALVYAVARDQTIDAKIQAGMADVRAGMQQQVADASAVAHAADTNSRVALDKVEQTQVQLGAAGLVKPSTH